MACQAACQQLCPLTLVFKATDFCQPLEDAIALPDFLLAAAVAMCVCVVLQLWTAQPPLAE
eukprot:351691-Chlamydomonas_euryale.AAC.2